MRNILRSFILISVATILFNSTPSFAGITFDKNQVDVVIAPNCNHVPISIPYETSDDLFDESNILVSSDAGWVTPSVNTESDKIDLSFATEGLIASYTATITVDDGENEEELFIHVNVPRLNIYRLVDDPIRSKTYGIQRDGIYNGSIVAFDPINESYISCITVGESPTDFVINEESSELFVINSVSKDIDVIDLETFSHKETITLPAYDSWGDPDDTTANIELGPEGIIYYVDGSWGPVLHVYNRSTKSVIQTAKFGGSFGFMDLAVTSDKTKMVAMPQYGWSAGSHTAKIGHWTINPDGTLNFVKETSLSSFDREPFEAPVLISDDDQVAVMKTISVDPADTDNLYRSFPSAIWSINPNGSVVATGDKLYEYETGKELYSIPGGSTSGSGYTYRKAQAFTSDFTRFVYFNSQTASIDVVNLIEEIGLELIGRSITPTNGSVVSAPDELIWSPLSGIDQYDLYLGTDYDSVASADDSSSLYLGRITGTSFELLEELDNGQEYFWRVDPVTPEGVETGIICSFTVSDVAVDVNEIEVKTIVGHSDYIVEIDLSSKEDGVSWSVAADDSWVSFTEESGATPTTLVVHIDGSQFLPGFYYSSITLSSEDGELQIPVQLEVEKLNLTHIRSDRNSEKIYAISEDTTDAVSKAYLLEIDSATEKVLRVLPVGSSVTDFTIHNADEIIYVTNWKSGNLLAIDKNTFEHTNSIAFQPAGATGYSQGDVYRVAAGASQRLVVEEEDQWIDIGIFNTNTEETMSSAHMREGGGAFGPAGRYYYHGENNSSGASILKFDTSGDSFLKLYEVRPPEIASYYGSRTVVVSEDGSRIFWAGVALDENLNTEWGIGETIYSASTNGRYAFALSAIYDVNLRRKVLGMPVDTKVSGYNSTTEKLMIQENGTLKFYKISNPITIPAPELSAANETYSSVELNWTDKSLELQFLIQQRRLGESEWEDIKAIAANVTTYTVSGLKDDTTYEFRIRASASEFSSSWSDIATATTLQRFPNEAPVSVDDNVQLIDRSGKSFSVTGNDYDTDGDLDLDSITIVTEPQFGEVIVNAYGEITYTPGDNFDSGDSFSYTVNDDEEATSNIATVNLIYTPAPSLSAAALTYNSAELSWSNDSSENGFIVQQRVLGSSMWFEVQTTAADVSGWIASGLQEDMSYQYRVMAFYSTFDSPWSNIITVKTPLQYPNENPVAVDDVVIISEKQGYRFSITENDSDPDGEINNSSIVIVIEPEFGDIAINAGGEVTYTPGASFVNADSFSYTVKDDDGAVSNSAAVSIIYTPAPVINIENSTYDSIELSWADQLQESGYVVQKRLYGTSAWSDVQTMEADVADITVSGLAEDTTYEFRVRASYSDYYSPWSDIVTATTTVQFQNQEPVAVDDVIAIQSLSSSSIISVTENDSDSDGDLDLNSIAIISEPQFGEVMVNSNGEVSYTPGEGFLLEDSFSYTINDNDGASSQPATVTIKYIPAPTLSFTNPTYDSVELSWVYELEGAEFIVQQRLLGSDIWNDVQVADDVNNVFVEALEEGSAYEFRAQATYQGYSSAWSNKVSFIVAAPQEKGSKGGGGTLDLFMIFGLVVMVMIGRRGTYRKK